MEELNAQNMGPELYIKKGGTIMACMAYMVPLMNTKGWEVCPRPVETTAEKAPDSFVAPEILVETVAPAEEISEADKMTIAEAAELSGLTKATIKSRMQTGKLQNVGIPGAPKVLKSEIEALE